MGPSELQQKEEIWQVDVNGAIYEAPLTELGEWITGGSVLSEDKVRKGNLRWIEAGKVPTLVPFFNSKGTVPVTPVRVSNTIANIGITESAAVADTGSYTVHRPDPSLPPSIPDGCANHPYEASRYQCDQCQKGFCRTCVNSYGGNVCVCRECGGMCRTKAEAEKNAERAASLSVDGPFGAADLARAIAHPFRFKTSLIFGTGLFIFFSLGQNVMGIGGIFMFAAALICMMLSNMLTFGILSNTINNFVQGHLDSNFMPDFEDFNAWDDVIHPFILSIGAYLSSFGPFLLTAALGVYIVFSVLSGQAEAFKAKLETIPGTEVYKGRELSDQTGDVKKVLDGIQSAQKQRIEAMERQAADVNGSTPPAVDIDDGQAALESVAKRSAKNYPDSDTGLLKGMLSLPAPLVILALLLFIWGALLFPASCAVAGYTRSFVATVNPLVVLNTVRHLGFDYVKLLGMCFLLAILGGTVVTVIAVMLSPFSLPGVGNFPATVLSSCITFYMSIVFSCLLGLLLFKSADRLQLKR